MRTLTLTLVGAAALAAGLILVKSQRSGVEAPGTVDQRVTQSGERSDQITDLGRLRELGI